MLLICPVRPGDSNEELRYAIRSWETNLILPDLELMTVGHCPKWLNPDLHVIGNLHSSMPLAVFHNVRLGAEIAYGMHEDEVIFMNDDFFCLDPVGQMLPVRRNCSLAEHLKSLGRGGTWWARSMNLTFDWLTSEGFTDPDSFEVHRPLLANPLGMTEALERWTEGDGLGNRETVPQWRTVYGVLNKVQAYPVWDAKLGLNQTGYGTPWVSTSDLSWRRYAAGIMKRFQKPSRWEAH